MARIEVDENVAESAEVDTNADTNADNATEGTSVEAGDNKPAEPDEAATAAKLAEEEAASAELQAAFEAAVKEALGHEGRDEATGVLPEAALRLVTTAYSKLPGAKLKRGAKEFLALGMDTSMARGPVGFQDARSYLLLSKAITEGAGKRETVTRTPVDPTEQHVALVAALMLAPNLVSVPDGVAEDWLAQSQAKVKELWNSDATKAYREWLKAKTENPELTDETPEVDPIVESAVKLASGRSAGVRRTASAAAPRAPRAAGESTNERKNIAVHIAQAFAGKPAGTFMTISEIAGFHSEEYGDRKPSAGAVAARLFPQGDASKCSLEGVEPVTNVDGNGRSRKGAAKL